MDLKAGFQNIPVAPSTKPLLGLVTQDGLYQWERMAFGLVGAPMHFQHVIDTLLSQDPTLKAVGYLDDVTAYGDEWRAVWDHTLRVLGLLTSAGFMVNLRKCHFLQSRVTVLGCNFHNSTY